MLAYRHAFHAGNHADVLKHTTLVAVLQHLNLKDKGYRIVDTHAGAGAYALRGRHARLHREYAGGVARLWASRELPTALRDYIEAVRRHNGPGELRHYPGSPELARMMMRPQDQLRLFELHATDHAQLAGRVRGDPRVELRATDGFAALKSQLPPPTRRALVLIDPSYELKADYTRVLAALRDALARFAECTVMVWLPQLQLLESARLPQRLRAAASGKAPKGWLLARLTVARPGERGFGMLGSWVFVANPPHTLAAALRSALPRMARELAVEEGAASWACESSE